MNRKFKLLILSLLGFSAACSGVKNNSKSQPQDNDDKSTVVRPDIRLMYGVRRPVPVGKVDTLNSKLPTEARTQKEPEIIENRTAEEQRIVAMYGVRVPMENIDLDSLKRAQQERQQQAAEKKQEDNQ